MIYVIHFSIILLRVFASLVLLVSIFFGDKKDDFTIKVILTLILALLWVNNYGLCV